MTHELKGKILFAKIEFASKTRDGLISMLNTEAKKSHPNTKVAISCSNDINEAEKSITKWFEDLDNLVKIIETNI